MAETKIRGLKINLEDEYIEIHDAYQINNKEKMKEVIEEAINKIDFCVIKRSTNSMIREWAMTNRLYRWHIFQKRNSKCKIKKNISLFKKIFIFLLGFQQINIAKFKKRLEKKKMSDFSLGTLYDVNKNLVQQNEPVLNEGILNSKKEIIKNYLLKTKNTYYILLSNERRDYTIFTMGSQLPIEKFPYEEKSKKLVSILVDECLKNRGEIRGIDLTKEKDAIEIWMSIEGESYVYYFFPYDNAIIDMNKEMEVSYEEASSEC